MFRCWITRIVSNTCYTMLKRKKRFSAAEMLNETQEIENGGIENQELHDAVGRLPMDIRLAIVLHYLEGFSTKEIAELTRRPEGTVRNRLYRGRQQLKDMLGEEMTL